MVLGGEETAEVFSWLRQSSTLYYPDSLKTREIGYDFSKFVVNVDGRVILYNEPLMVPLTELRDTLESLFGDGTKKEEEVVE